MSEFLLSKAAVVVEPIRIRRPYARPLLSRHGDLVSITKAEYGGLDLLTHGVLFAMASPGLPIPPGR